MNTAADQLILHRKELVKASLSRAMSYPEYKTLVSTLALEGKSTSPEANEALSTYTKLNDARMRRLDKSLSVPRLQSVRPSSQTWLVITESWCGDAAQTIPVINKIALELGVELKLVLRDQETTLMDAFLTAGARSIPVVILFDRQTEEILGQWGPRPSVLTDMVAREKAEQGKLSDEFKKELQIWYNRDKGKTTVSDFEALLKTQV